MTLEVRGLAKSFGKLKAVDDVTFSVGAGEICGFIGPNGAGKTTTMRIASTLDLPDGGDALIDGHSVLDEPREVRHRLGFMPDAYGAYPNTTVLDYLDFYARAYGLTGRRRTERIAYLMDFTALGPLAEKPMGALSKGMKQRLCLAKTMLHDPPTLILDEPAAGLDPRARIELRELVKALAAMKKAILVSSHILSELGEMCDSVCVIEAGRLVATGDVDELARGVQKGRAVFLRALAGAEVAERALLEQPMVAAVRRDRDGVVFGFEGSDEELATLIERLVQTGVRPIEIAPESADLEDVFLNLTEGLVQ